MWELTSPTIATLWQHGWCVFFKSIINKNIYCYNPWFASPKTKKPPNLPMKVWIILKHPLQTIPDLILQQLAEKFNMSFNMTFSFVCLHKMHLLSWNCTLNSTEFSFNIFEKPIFVEWKSHIPKRTFRFWLCLKALD